MLFKYTPLLYQPFSIYEPKIEYKPEDTQFSTKFGTYQISTKIEGEVLTYTRKFEMNRGRFPKETYKELVEFLKNVAKADKKKVVLVQSLE